MTVQKIYNIVQMYFTLGDFLFLKFFTKIYHWKWVNFLCLLLLLSCWKRRELKINLIVQIIEKEFLKSS